MVENTISIAREIEVTMACVAFAEAGEPCPIDGEETATAEKMETMSVADTMACTAFAEAGEPCPIGDEKGRTVH